MSSTIKRANNKRGIYSTLYDPRLFFNEHHMNLKVLELQKKLIEVDYKIGFAHVVPPIHTYKYVNTRFGHFPTGSPLSMHLQVVEPHFEIISNIEKLAKDESTIQEPEIEFEYLPLKEINDDYNDIIPNCTFSFEKKNYLEKIKVTYLEAKDIEKTTVLQNLSDKWLGIRRNKITSSNAHKVYIKTKTLKSLISVFTQKYNLFDSKLFEKAVQHGKEFEPIARDIYKDIMKHKLNHSIKCRETGIVIQPKLPWLAASPDGMLINGELNNEIGLIEIKCPWSKRNYTPKELVLDKSFYVKIKNDKPVLRKKHENGYYTQIQIALGISQVTFCDFIVYTFKGCIIIRIPFDIMYFKDVVNKLNLFFIKYLLPAIVELETNKIEQ